MKIPTRSTLSFLLGVICLASLAEAAIKCGVGSGVTSSSTRIVGGTEAQPHEDPWVAFVQIQHIPVSTAPADLKPLFMACDGSLIDDQWILTAAHCFTPQEHYKINQTLVVLGAYNLANKAEERLVAPPNKVIPHEKYQFGVNNSKYDIAMIKLPGHLDLERVHDHITPICLPKLGEMVRKTECQAIGWGKTGPAEDQKPSSVLKVVAHPMIDSTECHDVRPEVNELQVCAGFTGHSTCQGDSGGPLQCHNQANQWVIEGIVSYGDKMCGGPIPAVFTRVDQFLDWIAQTKAHNV